LPIMSRRDLFFPSHCFSPRVFFGNFLSVIFFSTSNPPPRRVGQYIPPPLPILPPLISRSWPPPPFSPPPEVGPFPHLLRCHLILLFLIPPPPISLVPDHFPIRFCHSYPLLREDPSPVHLPGRRITSEPSRPPISSPAVSLWTIPHPSPDPTPPPDNLAALWRSHLSGPYPSLPAHTPPAIPLPSPPACESFTWDSLQVVPLPLGEHPGPHPPPHTPTAYSSPLCTGFYVDSIVPITPHPLAGGLGATPIHPPTLPVALENPAPVSHPR